MKQGEQLGAIVIFQMGVNEWLGLRWERCRLERCGLILQGKLLRKREQDNQEH